MHTYTYTYVYTYTYTHTHTHNGVLLSQNLAICNHVDGARVYYAKRNKSVKDKYHMISLRCGI